MAAPTLVLLLPVLPQLHDRCRLVHTLTIMPVRYPLAGTLVPEPPGFGPARSGHRVGTSGHPGTPGRVSAREETMAGDEGPFPGILSPLAAISAAVRHLSWEKSGFIQAGG